MDALRAEKAFTAEQLHGRFHDHRRISRGRYLVLGGALIYLACVVAGPGGLQGLLMPKPLRIDPRDALGARCLYCSLHQRPGFRRQQSG